ncbi:MAG: hypothetical protein LBH96_01285 [Candidatus Peribacteria bacterium]|nr:hypothetical protein [Candidatus Peribacteria bacterium]
MRDLVQVYEMVEIISPMFEPKATTTRYKIKDNFLDFRFRYVYANREFFEL